MDEFLLTPYTHEALSSMKMLLATTLIQMVEETAYVLPDMQMAVSDVCKFSEAEEEYIFVTTGETTIRIRLDIISTQQFVSESAESMFRMDD